MSRLAKICDALSLSGVGLLMWFGQGMPSVTGGAISVAVAILLALIIAKPFYELATAPWGVRTRIEQRFGIVSVYLIAAALLLLAPYVYLLERLNRIELIGHGITLLGFTALAFYGFHRARRTGRRGIERLLSTLLIIGYAGTGGALLAGQVQFSIVALSALGLAQLFDWFVFGEIKTKLLGSLFAFVIPLVMLLALQIGHALALPLIASFILGTALIFRSEEAKYLPPQA